MHVESIVGIQWEVTLNRLFTDHRVLGLIGSYWYATLHYVVTAAVLIWLWRLGADRYGPARRALAIGTLLALLAYIWLPTAPPRFIGGYVDVLSLHAADGWWGADASAPRGLGGLTNELAAFPSMHAGWALWVALALQIYATKKWVRVLGWAYALGTAVVIVGTGNHWVIDALVGWVVIVAAWVAADAVGRIPLHRTRPGTNSRRTTITPGPVSRRLRMRPTLGRFTGSFGWVGRCVSALSSCSPCPRLSPRPCRALRCRLRPTRSRRPSRTAPRPRPRRSTRSRTCWPARATGT